MGASLATAEQLITRAPRKRTLEERRLALNWTYENLAHESGLKEGTVYAICKRHGTGGKDKIALLESALERGETGKPLIMLLTLRFEPTRLAQPLQRRCAHCQALFLCADLAKLFCDDCLTR